MANMGTAFDPTTVEPDSGRPDPIPEGRYVMQVIDSDVVENSKGTGQILKLTLEVFDGPLKGRKMFENINYLHEKLQVQEIGQKQLSALCSAAGITAALTDSQDLHFQPFEADVGIEPPSEFGGKSYGPRNKINRYIFGEADQPPVTKAAPKAAPASRPAANARPWDRNKTAA